jgi:hypothetical protein
MASSLESAAARGRVAEAWRSSYKIAMPRRSGLLHVRLIGRKGAGLDLPA